MFRLVNKLHSKVKCYKARAIRRLGRGKEFIGVSTTSLGRDRPRSVRVAGRTPGCDMSRWVRNLRVTYERVGKDATSVPRCLAK